MNGQNGGVSIHSLTAEQFRQIGDLKTQIEHAQEQIAVILSGATPQGVAVRRGPGRPAGATGAKRGPKHMTPAHKRAIAAAQKKRWAEFHAKQKRGNRKARTTRTARANKTKQTTPATPTPSAAVVTA